MRFPQFILFIVCMPILLIHLINRKRIHNLFEADENDLKTFLFLSSLYDYIREMMAKKRMLLIFRIAKDKCSLECSLGAIWWRQF